MAHNTGQHNIGQQPDALQLLLDIGRNPVSFSNSHGGMALPPSGSSNMATQTITRSTNPPTFTNFNNPFNPPLEQQSLPSTHASQPAGRDNTGLNLPSISEIFGQFGRHERHDAFHWDRRPPSPAASATHSEGQSSQLAKRRKTSLEGEYHNEFSDHGHYPGRLGSIGGPSPPYQSPEGSLVRRQSSEYRYESSEQYETASLPPPSGIRTSPTGHNQYSYEPYPGQGAYSYSTGPPTALYPPVHQGPFPSLARMTEQEPRDPNLHPSFNPGVPRPGVHQDHNLHSGFNPGVPRPGFNSGVPMPPQTRPISSSSSNPFGDQSSVYAGPPPPYTPRAYQQTGYQTPSSQTYYPSSSPFSSGYVPPAFTYSGHDITHDSKPRKRRGNLPKEVTDKLRAWFLSHISHPYPTEEEKQQLMRETRLQMNQISNWFINARRRQLPAILNNMAAEHSIRDRDAVAPGTQNSGNNHPNGGDSIESRIDPSLFRQ